MTPMRVYLLLALLALMAFTASAQDVPVVDYNDTNTAELTEDNLQFFAQFNGSAGDVVYLLADYEDFVIATIELDLRDSVGRTVGFRGEHLFKPFVIAELPADGLYTIVITAEEAGDINYIVGKSGYLEDGVEASIDEDSFNVLFLVRAEDSANYTLSFQQDGSLATDFSLITFSEFFNENVIQVSGTSINQWNANIALNEGDTYVAFLGRNLFSSGGDEATVTIQLDMEE